MIRTGVILSLARAEARLMRRLIRYWLFVALAFLFGVGMYGVFAARHWFISSWGATMSAFGPRYLLAMYGQWYLLMFMFGLVFLAFDVRARDQRERIVEVLDSRPCTNLELVFGRALGILFVSWVPVVIAALTMVLIGAITGLSVEPVSLLDFCTFMAIPAFTFTIGITMLLSLLVRYRLIVVVVMAVFFSVWIFGTQSLPVWLSPAWNIPGGWTLGYPSDLARLGWSFWTLGQRLGTLLAGVGLLALAAAFHPRLDVGSRGTRLAGAGVVLAFAAVMLGGSVMEGVWLLDEVDDWKAAHEARSADPAPDIRSIKGEVRIDPGKQLGLDLAIRFAPGEGEVLETALFTLNPGMRVEQVGDADGAPLTFTHENGLLDVTLPAALAAGQEQTILLRAAGRPMSNFAYLDAYHHPLAVDSRDAVVFLLGYEPMAFGRRYVALMPGVRWLPASGADVGRADPQSRPIDFFEVDLKVDLPEGWVSAVPGRRHTLDGAEGGRVLYRYAPQAPVPQPALIASRFESRYVDVDGVRLELLLHRKHLGNLDMFEDTANEIKQKAADRLEEAPDMGLPYPYDGLTLVEAPNPLRGYGGGWKMDTVLAPPGIVMIREAGFPTARFEAAFRNPEQFEQQEGGLIGAKRERLERFFENDISGGNLMTGVARNFFRYQTAARGPGALALDFALDKLAGYLILDAEGFFSVHMFDAKIGQKLGQAVFAAQVEDISWAESAVRTTGSSGAVWEAILEKSLTEMDPWEDPSQTLDVLVLKGSGIAKSLLDGLGRAKSAQLLAKLREDGNGGSYTREDVIDAGREIGEDLEPLLSVWLDETALPGFVVEHVRAYRIEDTEDGTPQYQLRFTVTNGEKAPGLFVVETVTSVGDDSDTQTGDPVRVGGGEGIEVGLVRSELPQRVTVKPYLSLNRQPFVVTLPTVDTEKIVDEAPFDGTRPYAVEPADEGTIVVDDLDQGFRVAAPPPRPWWRLVGRGADVEKDQGLPVLQFNQLTSDWSRMTVDRAWGKYRHTTAVIRRGEGDRNAVFAADVPRAGQWTLELHVPDKQRSGPLALDRGTWSLAIEDDSGREETTFDADAGEPGWNVLGEFELAGGEVRVELSNKSEDGKVIIADAVRWVASSRQAAGS